MLCTYLTDSVRSAVNTSKAESVSLFLLIQCKNPDIVEINIYLYRTTCLSIVLSPNYSVTELVTQGLQCDGLEIDHICLFWISTGVRVELKIIIVIALPEIWISGLKNSLSLCTVHTRM
jgi:hypothetical protein